MYPHYGPRTYITGSGYTKPRRIAQNRPVDYGLYTVCGIWGMYRIMDLRAVLVCVYAHAPATYTRVLRSLWLATRLRKLGRSHLENPGGDWFVHPASLSPSRSVSSLKNRKPRVSPISGSIVLALEQEEFLPSRFSTVETVICFYSTASIVARFWEYLLFHRYNRILSLVSCHSDFESG